MARGMRGAAVLIALLAALAVAGCAGESGRSQPAAKGVTVWAVGDAAAGTAAARRVARRIRRARPDLLLYLGDVYPGGTWADFERNYAPLYGGLAGRTLPTPGNHDWPRARTGYLRWWRARLGRRLPSYYARDAGAWRILSLNSELRGAAMDAQVRWLRRQVRGGGTCRLAFWHRPRFSAGMHGDQRNTTPFWRALRGRARIVIGGHDHDLQRMRRRAGITEFVSGAGGNGRYPLRRDGRLAFGDDDHYGALRLGLAPGRARFAFVSGGGRVLDDGRLRCEP
jgi:acid phosphatase type 7